MRYIKLLSPCIIIFVVLLIGAKPTNNTPKPKDVKIHGSIICLSEEMNKNYKVELFNEHEHLYGVKSKDGKYFTLLWTSLSEALFVDKRLHERELVISGRTFPNSQLLEVNSFSSIRDGILFEVYYYCDTCYIRSVAPGKCDCCQAPVVLIERPLNVDSLIPSP